MDFRSTLKQGLLSFLAVGFLFAAQTITAQTFWAEDFSNGIPAGWSNTDITSNAGEEVTFAWADDPTAVNVAALGNAPIENFASSTVNNGYAWANSDRGLTAAPSANHTAQFTTTAIDCSGQDVVFFRSESLIGVFDLDAVTNAVLRVSTTGDEWDTYTMFPGLTTATRFSANPAISTIDISETAANASTVFLQFQWQGGWEYFWAIDDITLSSENPAPPVDLQVNSPLGEFYAIAPNAVTPISQVEPFGFLLDVANIGSEDQTNVNVNLSIFNAANAATAIYSEDLSYGNVAAGEIVQNQLFQGTFVPTEPGSYIGRYTITSDAFADEADPSNNVQEFTFEVSDALFAKETGATRAIAPAASNWQDGEAHSWAYGNCFYVPNGEGFEATTIDFSIANAEDIPNQQVTLWLYKWEDLNGDAQSQDDERTRVAVNSYSIVGTETVDQLISVDLFNFIDSELPITLEDDAYYIAMVEFTSPDDMTDLFLGGSEAFDYSAMRLLTDSIQSPRYASFLGIGTETEYSPVGFGADIVPVVRLAIDEDTSIEELSSNNLIEVYPNPVQDQFTLNVEFEKMAENLNIRIMDARGRLMVNQDYSNFQSQQLNYNVSKWANGTYFVHLITEEGMKTQRVIVQQ